MNSDSPLNFREPVTLDNDAYKMLKDASTEALGKYRLEKRLSDNADHMKSMRELTSELSGNQDPNYRKPNIVAAYLSKYHLNHCVMAYQIFSTVLRQPSMHKVENIYVCDVGAGIGAGLVGLLLALGQQKKPRKIYFDMIESSKEMTQAAEYYYQNLKFSSEISLKLRWFRNASFERPELPKRTINIISAFHLTWPYKVGNLKTDIDSAYGTINRALERVWPHLALFTCHIGKKGSIARAVAEYFRSRNFQMGECPVPLRMDFPQTPKNAQFLWACRMVHRR